MFTNITENCVLIVGLGNPGNEYSKTRHNLGWMVLDVLHESIGFNSWNYSGNGLISTGIYAEHPVILLKPLTMMNSSGEAVINLTTTFEILPERIIVIHDELDIPFNDVRYKLGGGHAGHRGVGSIISQLNSPDFHRVRCGIGKPDSKEIKIIDHVLSQFNIDEKKQIPNMLNSVCDIISQTITKIFI